MLTTERLILRKARKTDVTDLLTLVNSNYVQKYNVMLPYTRDIFIEELDRFSITQGFCIVEKASRKAIGVIHIDPDRIRYGVNSALISYWLGEKYAGKGYMSEALHAALTHCFNFYHYDIITARVFAENEKSHKLIKKLGFKQEGYLKTAVKDFKGVVHDDVMYSLFKEDFENTL